MNITTISIFIVSIIGLVSCNNEGGYTALTDEESIELIKSNEIDFFKIKYTDENALPISDSLRIKLNHGKVIRKFYRNNKGIVDQIRLFNVTDDNVFYEIRIRELQQDPFVNVEYAEIQCDQSDELLKRALKRDQDVRKGLIENMQLIDKINRDTIISILDNCDWPKTKADIESIWYVIQHAGTGKMAYYYPKFKAQVINGLLEDSLMAKMEDRMLMFNGFPQIYGTQYTVNPKAFHEIKDIQNVNARRKRVGLCSIEQKAKNAGIHFNWEDYKTNK